MGQRCWRLYLIVYLLLCCATALHADECVKFHKRAPVPSVCGRIINIAGERLDGVDVELIDEGRFRVFVLGTFR